VYFDSFGYLRLSKELVRYFENGAMTIEYNRMSYQTYDQSFCGQMCLRFLQTIDARDFKKNLRCEILVFIERFFRHVIDAYTEREEHRSRGELFSRHRFELIDGDYEFGLAIFETYHTIPNVNKLNNKFYFTKDDKEITIPESSYEVRDINEFLKCAILRKHSYHDALETVDVVHDVQ